MWFWLLIGIILLSLVWHGNSDWIEFIIIFSYLDLNFGRLHVYFGSLFLFVFCQARKPQNRCSRVSLKFEFQGGHSNSSTMLKLVYSEKATNFSKSPPYFSHKRMLLAKQIFKFHAWVQKFHFGNFSFLTKWHFWTWAWNSNFFWPKAFFWSIMKIARRKNIHIMSHGPPNPGFMQEEVQKGKFQKKGSRELNFFVCFRFLWIFQRLGMLN